MYSSSRSLRPNWPWELLPIENNSPRFERIKECLAPQATNLIKMSKLRLFGTDTALFGSCFDGS